MQNFGPNGTVVFQKKSRTSPHAREEKYNIDDGDEKDEDKLPRPTAEQLHSVIIVLESTTRVCSKLNFELPPPTNFSCTTMLAISTEGPFSLSCILIFSCVVDDEASKKL